MKELWSLVHWLYPSVFLPSTQRLFQESFDLSRGSYSLQFLKAAKNLLATIMLRRTKSVVEMSVPPKEELTVFVPLTEAQRFWTYRLLTRMDKLDLKQIFVTKSGSDQVVDEGRRQVQEQLRDQVLQNKPSGKPGITIPFFVFQ
jgi:SWI/SNF-related matrix-associated actin-dependent regulator of chromatin subfamily A member 5